MDKKLKIILGVSIVTLVLQLIFTLTLLNSLSANLPTTNAKTDDGLVSSMSRTERLDLLEKLWQSPDFKSSEASTRRKAFESIVVK